MRQLDEFKPQRANLTSVSAPLAWPTTDECAECVHKSHSVTGYAEQLVRFGMSTGPNSMDSMAPLYSISHGARGRAGLLKCI